MELGADTMRRPLCNWVEDIYKAMTCVCARDLINLMTMLWCVIFFEFEAACAERTSQNKTETLSPFIITMRSQLPEFRQTN